MGRSRVYSTTAPGANRGHNALRRRLIPGFPADPLGVAHLALATSSGNRLPDQVNPVTRITLRFPHPRPGLWMTVDALWTTPG